MSTARIRIKNNRTYRGPLEDAAALRALTGSQHTTGDYAQIYTNRRFYRYDGAAGAVGDDDGLNTIRPSDVSDAVGTGRWVSTNQIQLSGADSSPSQAGASIDTYEWFLVAEPSLGETPTAQITTAGQNATLTIPIDGDWKAGGILVFLKVTDSLGQESLSNPYSPFLNLDALFNLIVATEHYGLQVPPAGARGWHEPFLETIRDVDTTIKDVASAVPGASVPTKDDKNLFPTGATSGDESVVPGITISSTPGSDSYVRVYINGLAVTVGDGTKTEDCYFSNDAGATARSIEDITSGDVLVWNGVIATFDLDSGDRVDFDYVTA